MTKSGLKKLIVFLVFAMIVVIVLGVGTDGYRNWKFKEWFNYWGKGKPAVVRVVEPPAEQQAMALMSSNQGLTYDSEEAAYTVNVQRYDKPTLEWYKTDPVSFGSKTYNYGLRIHGNFCGSRFGIHVCSATELTFNNRCDHSDFLPVPYSSPGLFEVDPGDLVDIGFGNKFGLVVVYNVGSDEYLDSLPVYDYSLKFVDDLEYSYDYETMELEIPLVYDYMLDENSECSYAITISDNEGFSIRHTRTTPIECISLENNIYRLCLASLPISLSVSKNYTISVEPIYYINRAGVDTILADFPDFHFSVSQLAQPSGFSFVNGILSWNDVEGALGYSVFINSSDSPYTVNEPEFNFGKHNFGVGEYTFRVRALGNLGHALATSSLDSGMQLSAYNAAVNITQLATLTYNVDGDTVTKFVPVGSKLSEYTYEVKVPGKEFGGWFYDSGFSRAVNDTDTVSKDMTIYARLSDKKVMERKATWWDEYKWYVIGGIIVLAFGGFIAAVVVGIRKRKKV